MDTKPIYEKEPLPGEQGSKSGLPHSSYELARLRSNREQTDVISPNQAAYTPRTPRGDMQEAAAQATRQPLGDAIAGHVRRQILNAKAPGLGNMQGPLREDVQKAVDKKARPLIKQVVPYSVKKTREGKSEPVGNTPTSSGPKPFPKNDNPTHIFEDKVVSGIGVVSKRVPNPKYVPPAPTVEDTRASRDAAEIHRTRPAITAKFQEIANANPNQHPADVQSETEGWVQRNMGREATKGHEEHLLDLKQGLESQESRHPAMTERAKQLNSQGVTKTERESSADVVDTPAFTKAPRKTTDRDVMSVMRKVATNHWRSSPAAKLAGTVKNELTGQLHPGVKDSPAHKNPKTYMQKNMGIEDPVYHVESNYADDIRQSSDSRSGDTDYPLEQGAGTKPQAPKAPTATFAADYLKNRLGSFSAGSGEGKK